MLFSQLFGPRETLAAFDVLVPFIAQCLAHVAPDTSRIPEAEQFAIALEIEMSLVLV